MHEAKVAGAESVVLWGTGRPRGESLHVDDLVDALVHPMRFYDGEGHVNVGVGEDTSIAELAAVCAHVVGFEGRFDYDTSSPIGRSQATRRHPAHVVRLEESHSTRVRYRRHISLVLEHGGG